MFTHNSDIADNKYDLDLSHIIQLIWGEKTGLTLLSKKKKIPQWAQIPTFIITQIGYPSERAVSSRSNTVPEQVD